MSKKNIYFFLGMLSGGLIVLAISWYRNSDLKQGKKPSPENLVSQLKYPLLITLKRFVLNNNKEDKFNSWMRFYHDHDAENILTMEAKKMYFETMFMDTARQKETV